MVSTTGMVVSLKTDLRFPESGQQGHGAQIIQNVENKKSLFAGVGADSKYRCNLCGHLTKSYGQRCPHCGTVVSIYTATDVTFDATSYR